MRWPVEVRRSLEFADFFLNTAAPLGALLLPWMLPEAFKLPWNAVTVPPSFTCCNTGPCRNIVRRLARATAEVSLDSSSPRSPASLPRLAGSRWRLLTLQLQFTRESGGLLSLGNCHAWVITIDDTFANSPRAHCVPAHRV